MKYFIFLVLVLHLNLSFADPLEEGIKAYHEGRYSIAKQKWQTLAQMGLPMAQLFLAHLYTKGLGVPQDLKKANDWLRQAAEGGLAEAQYELGLRYEIGQGMEEDYWQAEKWYQQAIEQGFCPGELGLEKYLLPG